MKGECKVFSMSNVRAIWNGRIKNIHSTTVFQNEPTENESEIFPRYDMTLPQETSNARGLMAPPNQESLPSSSQAKQYCLLYGIVPPARFETSTIQIRGGQ